MNNLFCQKLVGAPLLGVLFFVILALSFSAYPAEIIDRETFTKRFIEKADIVRSYDYKIAAGEADRFRAYAQYFPVIHITAGTAPFPSYIWDYHVENKSVLTDTSKGTRENREMIIGDYTKSYAIENWGIALRAKIDATMPVYTFGKIENSAEAAAKGVAVNKAEQEISILQLRKEADKLYFSYVIANDMANIMDLALEKLTEAETKVDDWLNEGKEGVSQKDLIKIRIEKEKLLYGRERITQSLIPLNELIDRLFGPGWEIKDKFISKIDFTYTLPELEDHLTTKSAYARLITNGLDAMQKLLDIEISNFYPNIGIMANYRIDYTSSVDDSGAPVPNSAYNGHGGEAGIGLDFNLNILDQVAKYRKAKANLEAKKLEASFQKTAYLFDLKKKYSELMAIASQVEHQKKAHKMAKGLMTMEFMNYESGFDSATDLIDAVKTFIEQEYLLINACYEYNLKAEELLTAAGVER